MVQVGVIAIDGTKIAANASTSANRSQQWIRQRSREIAEAAVEEAAAVDAAEDAAEAASAPQRPPAELGTQAGRAVAIKRRWRIARQDAGQAEIDAADQARQEHYLARIEAGEVLSARPPAGWTPSGCIRPGSPANSRD